MQGVKTVEAIPPPVVSLQLNTCQMASPLLRPLWDQMAFLLHYGGRQLHVFSCSDTAGFGLA